ncbi:MAG: hypothetical protein A2Y17_10640 [Clostridiales bacterium GWF2_38_85]|nr:MAG: hypothetical protein A2Y17_10640 [Clostridiales bacterium GWF2_38_85]HBL83486.1 hypothetical protein [Clostridiales bacterium]
MEEIRGMIVDNEEKKFKKSTFGFDKKDVLEYIEVLEQSHKTAIFNYEKKISEQTNALTMAIREKDTLAVKAEELEKQLQILSGGVDEEKSKIIAENHALKQQIDELLEYKNKNDLLNSEIVELKTRCEFIESERQGLNDTIVEKEGIILELYKKNSESERQLKTEIERLKTQYESLRKVQLYNIQNAKENLTKLMNTIEHL